MNSRSPTSTDPHDLNRFVEAQAKNVEQALAELRAGRKLTHWSWYVLPQMRGLGSSSMSVRYGVTSLPEAVAFLAHPVLGPRLREAVSALLTHRDQSAAEILGPIDAQKFRSCLTLFHRAAGSEPLFGDALASFFEGVEDPATLALLDRRA